jgi:uncharacterized protein YjdB
VRIRRVLAAVLLGALSACSGEKTTEPVTVSSVSLTNASGTLQYGQTVQLSASVTGSNGRPLTGRTVTWSSSNDAIVSISPTGLVTAGAVRGGSAETATITVTSEGKAASAAVTVAPIPAATVTLSIAQVAVYVGQTVQLSVTVKDVTGGVLTGRAVTWSSASPTVATVTTQGLVTAIATGAATITAIVDSKSATASLTVALVPVSTVTVTPITRSLFVGETFQLSASTKDSAGNSLTGRAVTWASSNPAVATVSSTGVVTGVALGTATVTATSERKTASAAITVASLRVDIALPQQQLRPWQQVTAVARVYTASAVELQGQAVSWSSSNPQVIAVDRNGVITALFLGEANVIATSVGGSSDSAVVRVTVPGPVWASSPVEVAPGSETHVAINPLNPQNLAVSSNFSHNYSLDGGRTWTTRYWQGIAPAAEADPTVSFDHRGILYRQGLSLFTTPRHLYVDMSTDQGVTLTRRSAYQPTLAEGNPDQGILAIDTVSRSPYRGSLHVLFSDYPNPPSTSCRGFCLRVITSQDSGRTWSPPVDISDEPRLAQEHSSYLTIGPNGELYAAWRDILGRIMFTRSLDGGRTWSPNVLVRESATGLTPFPISDDVRGNVTIDVDRSAGPFRGRIYVSAVDLNSTFGGAADAWVVHSTNGGASWSAPVLLSDGPRGAFRYYFQPRISVAPNGRVDAVWYDTRNNISADINNVPYDVYFARSTDGGRSFSSSVRISTISAVKRTNCVGNSRCGDRQLFEYIGLVSDNSRSIAAWAHIRAGFGAVPGASNGQRIAVAVVWHAP